MRTNFIRCLTELAAQDESIFLLTGDIGFGAVEPFADRFPGRFINVGIAEQNMVGVAAGLALTGKKVFTYTIVNFAVTRCLEQIRVDVCYHNLDVTIVAVGGGLPYGPQGYTHHGAEDVSFMRVLPNMAVMVPCDAHEAVWASQLVAKRSGPAYIRLGRGGEPAIHAAALPSSQVEGWFELAKGRQIAIIANGPIVGECRRAVDMLSRQGVAAALVSVPGVSPLPVERLRHLAASYDALLVVEEHSVLGGLGSAVAEVVSAERHAPPVRRLGLQADKIKIIGDQKYLWHVNGIDAASIVAAATELVASTAQ